MDISHINKVFVCFFHGGCLVSRDFATAIGLIFGLRVFLLNVLVFWFVLALGGSVFLLLHATGAVWATKQCPRLQRLLKQRLTVIFGC